MIRAIAPIRVPLLVVVAAIHAGGCSDDDGASSSESTSSTGTTTSDSSTTNVSPTTSSSTTHTTTTSGALDETTAAASSDGDSTGEASTSTGASDESGSSGSEGSSSTGDGSSTSDAESTSEMGSSSSGEAPPTVIELCEGSCSQAASAGCDDFDESACQAACLNDATFPVGYYSCYEEFRAARECEATMVYTCPGTMDPGSCASEQEAVLSEDCGGPTTFNLPPGNSSP